MASLLSRIQVASVLVKDFFLHKVLMIMNKPSSEFDL